MNKVASISAAIQAAPRGDMTTTEVEIIQIQLERAYREAFRAVDTQAMALIAQTQSDVFRFVASGRAGNVCALSVTHANRVRDALHQCVLALIDAPDTEPKQPLVGAGLCALSAAAVLAIFWLLWINYKLGWLFDLVSD